MHFKSLELTEWQQFEKVSIELHDRLTVLTGANGSGKTTVLNLLAKHYNWDTPFLTTPKQAHKGGVIKFFSRLFNGRNLDDRKNFGSITYTNGKTATLRQGKQSDATYPIEIDGKQHVDCFFIPSHRPVYRYERLTSISTELVQRDNAFAYVSSPSRNMHFKSNSESSSSFGIKRALISWVFQGSGVHSDSGERMAGESELLENVDKFENVLRKVLPKTLGFERLKILRSEIVFSCNDGQDEFLLETASGGISSLIDMVWQIFMFSSEKRPNPTVLIDEMENHLHPIMQREILPNLISAFPSATFIVSTHSPLVVGSVRDSKVYALTYNDQKKIISRELDFENQAKTAAEVLDEVLGVSVTMPLWAEIKLKEIISRYSSTELDKKSFSLMREELAQIGLEKLLPSAMEQTLRNTDD